MVHAFLKKGEYTIKKSTIPNSGNGAFTNIFLPKGKTIGEYMGKRLTSQQYNKSKNEDYSWELSSPNGPFYIDATDIKTSNWLRYFNDSRKNKTTNIEPYQYRGKLYYRTIKNINPGSELFVSYGDEYFF